MLCERYQRYFLSQTPECLAYRIESVFITHAVIDRVRLQSPYALPLTSPTPAADHLKKRKDRNRKLLERRNGSARCYLLSGGLLQQIVGQKVIDGDSGGGPITTMHSQATWPRPTLSEYFRSTLL